MTSVSVSNEGQNSQNGFATTALGAGELEKFLNARGLDMETALLYGMSASGGRIKIPYIRDGKEVYCKYRGIAEKTFFCDEGSKPFLWNIDCLEDASLEKEALIITEGEFDALAAIQAGFPRSVSVPNGASVATEDGLKYLDEVENKLRNMNEIILATDADDKGQELAHALTLRLGKARCKWIKYPRDCKDLNDALRKYGARGVQETINRAAWMQVKGIYRMDELPPIPYSKPLHIGIPGFENHLNIRMSDFSVWTGLPGSGKTAFMNDMACRLNQNHGIKTAFASFEQPPQTEHKRNLRTWHSGKLEKYMGEEEKRAADKWIADNFIFIVPDEDDDVNLEWVLEKAAASVIRNGIRMIVIDPWNEMDHAREKGETLTEYTGMAIKQFRKLARKYRVHVAVAAHPAKMQRGKDGKYPVPTLYDISDSAHWFNKADLGVVVHRDEKSGDFIQIVKSRYHNEIGKPGVVDVKFSMDTGRYMVVDNSVLF